MDIQDPTLFDAALALPAEQRLRLADALLSSFNASSSPEIESAWRDEAEQRVAEIDAGEARLIDGEDAFARLRAKYGR